MTFQQVQKYENASNRVPASRLVHIARVLGVPVDALYGDEAGLTGGSARGTQAHRLADAIAQIPDLRVVSLIIDLVEGLAKHR